MIINMIRRAFELSIITNRLISPNTSGKIHIDIIYVVTIVIIIEIVILSANPFSEF